MENDLKRIKKQLFMSKFFLILYFVSGIVLLAPVLIIVLLWAMITDTNLPYGFTHLSLIFAMIIGFFALLYSLYLFFKAKKQVSVDNHVLKQSVNQYLILLILLLAFYHPFVFTPEQFLLSLTMSGEAANKIGPSIIIILRHVLMLYFVRILLLRMMSEREVHWDQSLKMLAGIWLLIFGLNIAAYLLSTWYDQYYFVINGVLSPVYVVFLIVSVFAYARIYKQSV